MSDQPEASSRRIRIEQETSRLTLLLDAVMRIAGRSYRDVERELEYSVGTVHRIVSGKSELKVRHILEILDLLKISNKAFFSTAYQMEHPRDLSNEQLMESLGRLGLPSTTPASSAVAGQLEDIIARAMERALKSQAGD